MIHQISIKDFVSAIYQEGDLNATSSFDRAQVGGQLHRYLQNMRGDNYQSEYYLKLTYDYQDITYILDGRADGIYLDEHIVEEIKSTTLSYDEINDQNKLHFAQCYLYAYIYALDNQLDEIEIHLTYIQIKTKEVKIFKQKQKTSDLENFFITSLALYHHWLSLQEEYKNSSINALKKLQFPFENYRHQQYQFASSVYKTIIDSQQLYVQAPCGIGKTISTLFPALKAIGEEKIDKIFYTCAKNMTLQVGIDTIKLLLKQQPFLSVVIYAKDKVCLLEKRDCDPKVCKYAKNYYGRNKQAIQDLLTSYYLYDKQEIKTIALKHDVCPFELSLDISLFCDVILCDYNYIFDPRVHLKRYFEEKNPHLILIDEAHNLVERARNMYSSKLSYQQIHSLLTLTKGKLKQAVEGLLLVISELKDNYPNYYASNQMFIEVLDACENFVEEGLIFFNKENKPHEEEIKNIFFEVNNYLKISEYFDEDYLNLITYNEQDINIEIFCLNPYNALHNIYQKVRSTILFSATLSPITYFESLLGTNKKAYKLNLKSPFNPNQHKLIIHTGINTRYQYRQNSLPLLIEAIYAMVSAKEGNYIVFFPSYAYLQQVADLYQATYPTTLHLQSSDMLEENKYDFLSYFQNTKETQLFFCVLGGIYSEGIDLKHDLLQGCMIVSLGLAQPNPYLSLIQDYFNEQDKDGYNYAYRYPAMNKVLQAMGRVIRTHEDYGNIILVDDRYHTPLYQQLLPKHYQNFEIINNNHDLFRSLVNFYNFNK